jgi:peptide-methionine (S)-S-oxide reductase
MMRSRAVSAFVFSVAALSLSACNPSASEAKETSTLRPSFPDPAMDIPPNGGDQVAVLAGGCFWTQEAVFSHIKGVKSVVSGYAGGTRETAKYRLVGTRKTGHAETVRIVYDPAKISYGRILKIFFAASHDPTQVDRQGPDIGPDYRSAIFVQNDQQRKVAAGYIAKLNKSGVFAEPIATRIETGTFYPAEKYHQDFVARNPNHPYVQAYDVEKLRNLRRQFPRDWKS